MTNTGGPMNNSPITPTDLSDATPTSAAPATAAKITSSLSLPGMARRVKNQIENNSPVSRLAPTEEKNPAKIGRSSLERTIIVSQ